MSPAELDETDPLEELVDRRRDELEEIAASDLRAAWVARALLEDVDGDGG